MASNVVMHIGTGKSEFKLLKMRNCKACNLDQPLDNYTVAKGYHIYTCKKCMQVRNKKWSQENPEKMREYVRAYKQRNKAKLAERSKLYVAKNTEKRKATTKAYRNANKAKGAEIVRRRQARLLQRTPSWLTAEDVWFMSQAYELAALRTKVFGFAWHVDHVLPLKGKLVSGLHTPYNLQVIPALDNLRKSNRVQVA